MSLLRKRRNGTYILDRREFLSRVKKITGFSPGNLSIYEKAFIHRSATLELEDGRRINNERLEFLGDAVLDTILSELLFSWYPEADEGELTKVRARVVNRDVLNRLALAIGIDTLLISQTNRKNPGKNLYGDALEALIGSVFIDKGYRRTRKFLLERVFARHLDLDNLLSTERDYKSQVFQWAQKQNRHINFSHAERDEAAINTPHFITTLHIDHELFGEGEGLSKKEAEQEASEQAWKKIRSLGYID